MYNISDYGAISDGKTINTAAIQAAINDCASNGGGKVAIPAGTFVTGTIFLKSNVELHLESGSTLKASENLDDYNANDAYEQNFGSAGEEWAPKHLIIAHEVRNVSITGSGTIDGSASAFYAEPKHFMHYVWQDGLALAKNKTTLRPGQLICFIESQHISVEGITIQNNTCWSCFFHGCEYVKAHKITIKNPTTAANTDGLDIDCCKYVTVSDCTINTGDDAIAIRCDSKRLKNKGAECEYITISNCVLASASSAFRIGVGVGKIHNVRISNIIIMKASSAFTFQTSYCGHGEAYIEDVNFSNISAKNICYPFSMQIGTAHIKHVTFENIRFDAVAASEIKAGGSGIMSDISFKNIDMYIKKEPHELSEEMLSERGRNILLFENIQNVVLDEVRIYPEDESTWDSALSIKKCKNIRIKNCSLED